VIVDTCIICNPAAGRGRAKKRLESLHRLLGPRADVRASTEPGHAEELAFTAARDGYAVVGAAGGDGTVHEVANGVLRAGCPETRMAVYPIGSANDYAYALGLAPGWWENPALLEESHRVDVGVIRSATGRQRYFVNGVGMGFQAYVTIESQRIKRLQGVALYTLALFRALFRHYHFPVLDITLDASRHAGPTLGFSVALGQREGNFVLARKAKLDDGLFDFLRVGKIPRWEMARYVPSIITGNLPVGHPQLSLGRCRTVRVCAELPLPVHLDGELFCRPEDGIRELEIRLLPSALRIQGFAGSETANPSKPEVVDDAARAAMGGTSS
jgi:diacylglycerol kinase family enzyme